MAIARAYGPAVLSLLNKEIDWDTDAVKGMLVAASYTPDQDTHRYLSSVTGEVTGTGYTAGGLAISGRTATYNAGTNTITLDCNDPAWTATTLTFRYLVFYVNTGTPSTSPLICYVDFSVDQNTATQDLTLVVPAAGLIQFVVA